MPKIGRRDTVELTNKILQVARDLFAQQGIEEVSMHQIAKQAKIGQGTLYRRYANKGEICIDLMKENFEQFKEEIERYLQAATEQSVKQKLAHVFLLMIQFTEKKAEWVCIIHSTFAEKKPMHIYKMPIYQFMHQTLSTLLEEAVAHDKIKPIDIAFTTHTWLQSFAPQSFRYLRFEKGYTNQQIVENLLDILVKPIFVISAENHL